MGNKILVLGNPNTRGLAARLTKDLNADCIGRKNGGIDIMVKSCRTDFALISLKYDAVILCAFAPEYSQVLLLQEVYETWVKNKKVGRIFTIGGSSERLLANQEVDLEWVSYPAEKAALKMVSANINANANAKYPGIFATHISPHHMNTEDYQYESALDVEQVSQTINWILQQKFHIEEISLRSFPRFDYGK